MDPNTIAPLTLTPVQGEQTAKPFVLTPVGGNPQEDPMLYTDPQKALSNAAEGGPAITPAKPFTLMAIGAAKAVNDMELWLRDRPDPDTYSRISGPPPGGYPSISAGDPEAQARIAELKGDYRTAGQLVAETQQNDSYPAKLVGNALLSAPSSIAGTIPFLLNAPLGAAMAGSLLWNYASEASSDYANRTLALGQERNAAYADATRHGLVATGLEVGPMAALGNLAKGAMTLKNAAPRFIAGEAGQEGATQLYDDLSTNASGLTSLSPGQIAQNAAEAAATGLLMSPLVGGPVVLKNFATQQQAQTELTGMLTDLMKRKAEAEAALQEVGASVTVLPAQTRETGIPLTPMTPEEEVQATIEERQRKSPDAFPKAPGGTAFGASLDDVLNLEIPDQSQDEGHVSSEVQENRAYRRSVFAPSNTPASQHTIIASTDERVVGLTPEHIGVPAEGSIVVIREDGQEAIFPDEPYQMLMLDMKSWMRKYAPKARLVLNLSQFAEEYASSAYGLYQPASYTDEAGNTVPYHVITPRELPGFKYQGGDSKTATALLTALTHEFGHMLVYEGFHDGLRLAFQNEELANRAMAGIRSRRVTPDVLAEMAQVAPKEAALVAAWAAASSRILDGTMTAEEYMETWAGARKVTAAVDSTKESSRSLYAWRDERINQYGLRREGLTALELLTGKPMGQITASDRARMKDLTSFDEYMAEQFSRHAYTSGAVLKSKFGEYFARTMAKLKALFKDLKTQKGADGKTMIAPGTEFKDWIAGLSARSKLQQKGTTRGRMNLSKDLLKAQKAIREEVYDRRGRRVKAQPSVQENALSQAEVPPAFVDETPEEELAAIQEEEQLSPEIVQNAPDLKADYLARLDLIFETFETPTKWQIEQHRKLKTLVAAGQFAEAEAYLIKREDNFMHWDSDYTSKTLERLGPKEKVKRATFELTMKQRDIPQVERSFWNAFLSDRPGPISLEEATWALQEGIMPLHFSSVREDRFYITNKVLGGESIDPSAGTRGKIMGSMDVTHVWEGEVAIGESLHYRQAHPNYVMHSRILDSRDGIRYVIELQSDIYQKSIADQEEDKVWVDYTEEGHPQTAREQSYMRKSWWKRLIREEIRLAFEVGLKKMRFRTGETAAALEGWDKFQLYNELTGMFVMGKDGLLTDHRMTGGIAFDPYSKEAYPAIDIEVILPYGGNSVDTIDSENPQYQLLYEHLQGKPDRISYGVNQVIFDRYAGPMAVFLQQNYDAKVVIHRGLTWLEIDVTENGDQNVYWDRDNPLSPMIAGTMLTDHAGLSQEDMQIPERVEAAQEQWKLHGFESPYFQKFFAGSKVTGNDGQPVRVWRSRGDMVLDTPGGQGIAFHTNLANLVDKVPEGERKTKQPVQQSFFLGLKNPADIDMSYELLNRGTVGTLLEEAIAAGYDGLILRNVQAPFDGTVYVTVSPEQIAQESDPPDLDDVDSLYWDADSDMQQTTRGMAKVLKFIGKGQLHAMNVRSRVVDYLIQLQQVAASQPKDSALTSFMFVKWAADRLKNQMQYSANEVTKSMLSGYGTSKGHVQDLHRVLQAELLSGSLQSELVGLDSQGNVIWGGTAPTDQALVHQVREWRVQDSLQLRQFMEDQGIDVTSKHGAQVLQHYLDVRNVFQLQFTGLANALISNAMRRFGNSPTLRRRELLAIEALHRDLRSSPFVPQGHFGKYVLIIKEDQGPVARGQRRFTPVFRKHYESEADFQQAYQKAQRMFGNNPDVLVTSRVLDETIGIPIQLPRELIGTLEESGEFTSDQLELLNEMMISPRVQKIGQRYSKAMQQIDGASDDFTRTFAAFTWHNSNYIWKLQYGPAMRSAAGQARTTIRETELSETLNPEEKLAIITRQRRNLALMEKAANYMLHPENELQALKYWATMAYLAYGISTAAFNLSTQLNYWAAITTEFGEFKGNKLYAQSLKDAATIPWWETLAKNGTPEEKARLTSLRWAYNLAVNDGLLDQSYAYYLAGQANSGGPLAASATTAAKAVGHAAMELGMLPFRAIERGNRLTTFLGYFSAEKASGASDLDAYQRASEKVDLLQNAYDAGNRPQLLRGKKSVLFMFASYTQFSQWTMWGGYERTARIQQRELGRKPRNAAFGTTAKLWLLYGLLGGLMGLPGADNMLQFVKWAWRKFFGTANVELELRKFLQSMDLNANTVMHGMLHDLGGFDSSGKFGLGRVIPGVDLLNREYQDPFTGVGQATLASAGPAGGLVADALRMMGKFGQGQIQEGFKEFPGAIGSIFKGTDAYLAQQARPTHGVTLSTGERLTYDKERGTYRDLTGGELVGMALGFNPTILSENRAEHFMLKGEETYWRTRRSDLMDKWFRARRIGDREMETEYLDEISRYNESVPFSQMRITGKDRVHSLRERMRHIRQAEAFGTSQKSTRQLGEEVRSAFRPSPPTD